MSDRPVEYIFFALKKRPFLLSMINNNTKFCMEDPESNMRVLYDSIADILKKFKQLKFDEKNADEVDVVRNLAFGQPSGAVDLKTFKNWQIVYKE